MLKKTTAVKPEVKSSEMFKQVMEKFMTDVVQRKNIKMTDTLTLKGFIEDKRFAKEFMEMYIDRTKLFFDHDISHLINEPVIKIVDFLTSKKRMAVKNNWPTRY